MEGWFELYYEDENGQKVKDDIDIIKGLPKKEVLWPIAVEKYNELNGTAMTQEELEDLGFIKFTGLGFIIPIGGSVDNPVDVGELNPQDMKVTEREYFTEIF